MKRIAILKYFLQVFLSMSLLSACNYLEVIPPEQANLDDTMKDANAVRNFLVITALRIQLLWTILL